MALDQVDGDREPVLGGGVDGVEQVLDRTVADDRPVRLDPRPDREHPDMVQPYPGQVREVPPYRVAVVVQPAVEPPGRRNMVGPEPGQRDIQSHATDAKTV